MPIQGNIVSTVELGSGTASASTFLRGDRSWNAPATGGAFENEDLLMTNDQANNTGGGSATSGAWRTLVINTSKKNNITGASLSSNQITLPAGTYCVRAWQWFYHCARNKLRFWVSSQITNDDNYRVYEFDDITYISDDAGNALNRENLVAPWDTKAGMQGFGFQKTYDIFSKLSYQLGKSLRFNVTLASPVCDRKSGITLLIFIMNSPSPAKPCCPISKLPDSILAGIADVLFGDYSPTGKLSYTWPKNIEQVPININDNQKPLFPFGFGLTY